MGDAEYALARFEEFAIPNTRRIADAMRAAGRPIIWCRCASLRGDGSDQTRRHRAQGLVCPVWERGAEIIDELGVQQSDIILTKSGSGCFTSTNLDHILGNMGVTDVVLTGCWTNSCVETTARHAGDLDYGVAIVEDAVVAMTPGLHHHALEYMDNNWARVLSTEQVLENFSALVAG
jgi:nicotinamidase-related amidase